MEKSNSSVTLTKLEYEQFLKLNKKILGRHDISQKTRKLATEVSGRLEYPLKDSGLTNEKVRELEIKYAALDFRSALKDFLLIRKAARRYPAEAGGSVTVKRLRRLMGEPVKILAQHYGVSGYRIDKVLKDARTYEEAASQISLRLAKLDDEDDEE